MEAPASFPRGTAVLTPKLAIANICLQHILNFPGDGATSFAPRRVDHGLSPLRMLMTRLESELLRLFLCQPEAADKALPPALIGASNCVRAMVFELTGPPSWKLLRTVWHGVQAELEMPAPAIAVSGTDGLQLWFALADPIAMAQAQAFLERLQRHFLPHIEASRVHLMPAVDALSPAGGRHARLVPALQPNGNWSSFVAPDLAPVFAETPWLDIPPSDDGQATLLSGLRTIESAVFIVALERLGPSLLSQAVVFSPSGNGVVSVSTRPTSDAGTTDPRRFLLQVMGDETVPLALRIEAAKALLQDSKTRDEPPC